MAYLTGVSPGLRELVTPTVDVYADGVGFNDGSSTSVTLSTDPGSENNIIVTFDGVTQHHDTYSVSGTTLSFDAAVPTGTAKIECRYASEHPAYTGVADNAVTLAKMASGTDGNLISFDASGNPVAVATGSDGQVLTSTGAGSPPAFEALAGSNVKEILAMVCDGSTTVVSSGSYTSTNVTAPITTGTSYVDLTGSSINYTPPSGTKSVVYEFSFGWGYVDASVGTLLKLTLAGAEVTNGRRTSSTYSLGDGMDTYKWIFKIGDGDVAATGKVASWGSGKIIKLQCRAMASSYQCKIHQTTYWDGVGANHLIKPTLLITALS